MRQFLTILFNKEFISVKIPEMYSPDTKKPLEFDAYCKILGIASEYNGKQHYEIAGFTKTEEQLSRRKYLDQLKKDYCIKNNILFLEIPYTITNSNIPIYIYCLLLNNQNHVLPILKLKVV